MSAEKATAEVPETTTSEPESAAPAAAESDAPVKLKVKKDVLGKAVRALVQVVKKRQAGMPQLFESNGETMSVIFTLGLIPEKRKMRPFMIQLPHPMFDETSEICFISKSPQKPWKDLLMKEKPIPGLSKVIGLDKLQKNYKTLEAKRALCDAFDLFLCDAAISEVVPRTLGKTFYRDRNKIPLPIKTEWHMEEYFQRAMKGTALRIPTGPCLGVKIGRCGMPEEHLAENAAVVIAATVKILHEKHQNYVLSVSVQATNAPALPVWQRPITPGGPLDLKEFKKGKKAGETTSSAASETGSSIASETEALEISELPSDAGETLSTRDTVSEQETADDTTRSEMDSETGDVDSESAPEKQDMPLLKGLKKRAKRRQAADVVAEEETPASAPTDSMPPPAKKAKKQKAKAEA